MAEQAVQDMEQAKKPDSELTLEEAFVQIEAVLKRMEQPDIPLSDALAEYERGIGLLKRCNEQIDRVEKQMITLRAGMAESDT